MTVTTVPTQSSKQCAHSTGQFSTTTAQERMQAQMPHVKGDGTDQTSYVLTLLTDAGHHACMNSLRRTYFPPKLNKIPAHITLFHALPGSKLESDVLPAIQIMVSRTAPYRIRANNPFALGSKKGIGIAVTDDIDHVNDSQRGRNMTRIIHAELRKKWGDWLSEQDATPVKVHYTVMNKVDDRKLVQEALEQLEESFKRGEDISNGHFDHQGKDDQLKSEEDENSYRRLHLLGQVQGLILWRYDKSGHWKDPKQFKFAGMTS